MLNRNFEEGIERPIKFPFLDLQWKAAAATTARVRSTRYARPHSHDAFHLLSQLGEWGLGTVKERWAAVREGRLN